MTTALAAKTPGYPTVPARLCCTGLWQLACPSLSGQGAGVHATGAAGLGTWCVGYVPIDRVKHCTPKTAHGCAAGMLAAKGCLGGREGDIFSLDRLRWLGSGLGWGAGVKGRRVSSVLGWWGMEGRDGSTGVAKGFVLLSWDAVLVSWGLISIRRGKEHPD